MGAEIRVMPYAITRHPSGNAERPPVHPWAALPVRLSLGG